MGNQEKVRGWLLDVKGTPGGVVLWIKTVNGEVRSFRMRLSPWFYLGGKETRLRRVGSALERRGARVTFEEMREFFTGEEVLALKVRASSPAAFRFLVTLAERLVGGESVYSSDIPVEEFFFYLTGVFPLGKVEVEMDETGEVQSIYPMEGPWDLDYALPPLSFMEIRSVGRSGVNPLHQPWVSLEVRFDGDCWEIRSDGPAEVVTILDSIIRSRDPDVVISEWGDEFVFPRLFSLARSAGIPFSPGRCDGGVRERAGTGKSFFSYGRMIYRAGRISIPGRIHLDRKNSFFFPEVGYEGMAELARISRIPLERVCRAAPGTIISAMEVERAWKNRILIPSRKRQVEGFKSAVELVVTDKGGLVYAPPVGVFEGVAELDFASMYPAIMEKFNISPETINCACCGGRKIPETGTHTCEKRRGLIPEVLKPILSRRKAFKALRSSSASDRARVFDARQKALKWVLVVSFGFLGYRNARFGKIEAHEAVTALGREMLLKAKDVAEMEGYSFIHGLTDAMWVKRDGATEKDYEELARLVSRATGLEIALEGVYRWVAFLPSRRNPEIPVPGRFLGVFEDGVLKVRGLACRRRDVPPLVRKMQEEMLGVLSGCASVSGIRSVRAELEEIRERYIERLRGGLVPPEELAIARRLSKPAEAYLENTATAWAVRELLGRGVNLPPGEKVAFVLISASGKGGGEKARSLGFFSPDYSYDVEKYEEMLRRAAEEVLQIGEL